MTKTLRVISLCAILPLAVLPVCLSTVSCGEKDDYIRVWEMVGRPLNGDVQVYGNIKHHWALSNQKIEIKTDSITSVTKIWYSSWTTLEASQWFCCPAIYLTTPTYGTDGTGYLYVTASAHIYTWNK